MAQKSCISQPYKTDNVGELSGTCEQLCSLMGSSFWQSVLMDRYAVTQPVLSPRLEVAKLYCIAKVVGSVFQAQSKGTTCL